MPPGPTSGRKRSVLLSVLSVALALAFQYGLTHYMVENNLPDNFVVNGWLDGCDYEDDIALQKSCVGNNASYRVSSATTLFFVLAGIAALCKPTANREAWPAKYVLYLFLVGITVLIPSDPLFSDIYMNIARVGGAFFILFQQIVILDLAYNWNESWVEKSNKAEAEEAGSGRKWLFAILASCGILFAGAIAVLVYMFIEFTGCTSNNAFISATLIFCILITGLQLSGDEASLLSSACVSAWVSFLCYTAVTKNPNQSCNPNLGEVSPLSIAFGLFVTITSLAWAGWSYTAEDKLHGGDGHDDAEEAAAPEETTEDGKRKVTGVVTGNNNEGESKEEDNDDEDANDKNPKKLSNSWKLNAALAMVACWTAMVLTHWGEIQSDGTIANPSVGRISMWMIMGSQWLMLSLYTWTLVAPRLFPNRDFS